MHIPLNVHRTFREKIIDLWAIFYGELWLECLTLSEFFISTKHTSAPIERVYQIPDNAAAQERYVTTRKHRTSSLLCPTSSKYGLAQRVAGGIEWNPPKFNFFANFASFYQYVSTQQAMRTSRAGKI
jgi:hypothetical protein